MPCRLLPGSHYPALSASCAILHCSAVHCCHTTQQLLLRLVGWWSSSNCDIALWIQPLFFFPLQLVIYLCISDDTHDTVIMKLIISMMVMFKCQPHYLMLLIENQMMMTTDNQMMVMMFMMCMLTSLSHAVDREPGPCQRWTCEPSKTSVQTIEKAEKIHEFIWIN